MTTRAEDLLAAAWRAVGLQPDAVARLLGPVSAGLLATGNRVPALRLTDTSSSVRLGPGTSPSGRSGPHTSPSVRSGAHTSPSVRSGPGADDDALAARVRLLVVGAPVPADAVPAEEARALTRLGIAEERDGQLHALLAVTPLHLHPAAVPEDTGAAGAGGDPDAGAAADAAGSPQGRPAPASVRSAGPEAPRTGWALADRAVPGRAPAPDHVIGPGPATTTLDSLTVPVRPGHRVLDLGTGSGYLALRAAGRGARVVATDVNPRALELTALGAALSGVDVDTRLGSLLEPVDGTFDRIVSNPPFVISGTSLPYRDAGAGDGLLAELLRGVGGHLAEGGVAQVLGNWEIRSDEDWRDRVGDWVGEDLDLWVVQRDAVDPATYVDTWLRDEGRHPAADPRAFEEAANAWLDALRDRGVTAVGVGHVTIRRRSTPGPPWRRLEEATGAVRHRLGDHVAAVLDAVERLRPALAPGADDVLREVRLAVAPDVTEVRHHRPGAEEAGVIELVQGGGYGRTVRASTGLAAVVGACDGELPAGVLVEAVAALLEVDPGALAAELLPRVRELVETGFLVPAD